MMETALRTLSVLVDNEPGVLSQISRLFSRKGFNIESLAVGPTQDRSLSRLTLEVITDDSQTELLCNQLSKMVPVHSVRLLADEHSIRRELVLCKSSARSRKMRPSPTCCGSSEFWKWSAPAWWRWSGAAIPFRTNGRKRWNSIWEKCCKSVHFTIKN